MASANIQEFLLYLSNHRWKKIIYQLRELKIYEINYEITLPFCSHSSAAHMHM